MMCSSSFDILVMLIQMSIFPTLNYQDTFHSFCPSFFPAFINNSFNHISLTKTSFNISLEKLQESCFLSKIFYRTLCQEITKHIKLHNKSCCYFNKTKYILFSVKCRIMRFWHCNGIFYQYLLILIIKKCTPRSR